MLQNEKILVTGITGAVAAPIAEYLVKNNEVWGLARFLDEDDKDRQELPRFAVAKLKSRSEIESMGIKTCRADLGSGDLSDVPDDFTYVLHFGFARVPQGPDQFELAFRINGDGTGFLMQHCRKAKAFLVVSSATVYSPQNAPNYAYSEQDELGRAIAPWSPSSPTSKIVQEGIAGYCARIFDLPTTIVRLFQPYGRPGGLMTSVNIETMKAGKEILTPYDPYAQSVIHFDDMCAQLEALLDAASTPALIVNWAGDEAVTMQHWCKMAGKFLNLEPKLGVRETSGAFKGVVADVSRRLSITGPCHVKFDDGFKHFLETYHS